MGDVRQVSTGSEEKNHGTRVTGLIFKKLFRPLDVSKILFQISTEVFSCALHYPLHLNTHILDI